MTYIKSSIPYNPIRIKANRFHNLTGQTFGRWLVLGIHSCHNHTIRWVCICKCQTVKAVIARTLANGMSQSCGCLHKELASDANIIHGESKPLHGSTEYNAYRSAKVRCINPNSLHYRSYGGRGIEFRFETFETFLEHIGRRPTPKHSLNRIDNDGHYEIGNVEWALSKNQMRNTRRTHWITAHGITQCIADWSITSGLKYTTITQRLSKNWCDACAVSLPVSRKNNRCQHNKV